MDIIALLGKNENKELYIRITSYVKGMSGKDVRAAILDEVQHLQEEIAESYTSLDLLDAEYKATTEALMKDIVDIQATARHFREEAYYYKQKLVEARVENERMANTNKAQKERIAELMKREV